MYKNGAIIKFNDETNLRWLIILVWIKKFFTERKRTLILNEKMIVSLTKGEKKAAKREKGAW